MQNYLLILKCSTTLLNFGDCIDSYIHVAPLFLMPSLSSTLLDCRNKEVSERGVKVFLNMLIVLTGKTDKQHQIVLRNKGVLGVGN